MIRLLLLLALLSQIGTQVFAAGCDVDIAFTSPIYVLRADCKEPISNITFYTASPQVSVLRDVTLPASIDTVVYLMLTPILQQTTFGATANNNSIAFGRTATVIPQIAPTPPACVYTYSPWGSCQPSGVQTRTASSDPGCVGTPVLTQSCVYTPPSSGQPPFPWTILDVVYHSQAEFDAAIAAGVFQGHMVRINEIVVSIGFAPGIDGTSP